MSSFTDSGAYVYIAPGLKQRTRDVRFYFNDDRTGEYVDLKKGGITNGVSYKGPESVLRTLRTLGFDPFDEDSLPAADLHDELVGEWTGKRGFVQPANRQLSWNEAALWFKKALQVKNAAGKQAIPSWKIQLYYGAVIVYGIAKGKK